MYNKGFKKVISSILVIGMILTSGAYVFAGVDVYAAAADVMDGSDDFMITISENNQLELQDALNLAATVGGSVEYTGIGIFFIYNNLTVPEGATLYLRAALGNINLQASARVYIYGKVVLEEGKQIINNGGIIYNYGEFVIDGSLSLQTGTLNNYAGAVVDATNGTVSQVGNRIGVDEGALIPLSKFGRYVITFEDWDGTVLKTQIAATSTWVAAPANPSRQWYIFTGWDPALGANGYYVTASPGDRVITAQYRVNTYTVKFVDWDGSPIDEQIVDYGGAAASPDVDMTRDHYTFIGWDAEFDYVVEDITVTALYEPFAYIVIYIANGGSFPSTGEYECSGASYWDGEIYYPENPVRDGYMFRGWYTRDNVEVEQGMTYCELVEGNAAAVSESAWAMWEEIVLTNLSTSVKGFVGIAKKPDYNNVWTLSFEVAETYSNGEAKVVVYSVDIQANNANVNGVYDLGGYTLIYDIKGNGSNIKDLRII